MSERVVACEDLDLASARLRIDGFRLDLIYPADEPHTARFSRGNEVVRLTTRPGAEPPSDVIAPFAPEFVLTRAGGGSARGRAGMHYRDLIPSRLGGRYIASHITISEGGPVDDWVHFHRLAFQMIMVRSGWVRVVYEDQGEPFVMNPGDLVLQPPEIRHRVLESAPGLEVIEISCPALHETRADHDLQLPNGRPAPERSFAGQHFLRHVAADAPWTPFGGGEIQETAMRAATGGLADARIIRASSIFELGAHDGELVFGFVLEGRARLRFGDGHALNAGTAFVIPPGEPWAVEQPTADFRLLHVATARFDENRLADGARTPL